MCANTVSKVKHLDSALLELGETTELLVKNAEKLRELSCLNIVEEELSALQLEQEQLIKHILELDSLCVEKGLDKESKNIPLMDMVKDKLKLFEELNKSFIANLEVRKGLIKFELNENSKAKNALKVMKASYAKQQSAGKTKFNTLS